MHLWALAHIRERERERGRKRKREGVKLSVCMCEGVCTCVWAWMCVCVCVCVCVCDCVRSSACRCLCARFHDSVTLVLRVTKSYRLGQCPIEKYLVNDPSFAVVSSGPLEHLHLDKRHVHTAFTDEQLLCTTCLLYTSDAADES